MALSKRGFEINVDVPFSRWTLSDPEKILVRYHQMRMEGDVFYQEVSPSRWWRVDPDLFLLSVDQDREVASVTINRPFTVGS